MPDHAGFIIAAYAATALVLGGVIAAILLDYRAQRRALDALERRASRGRTDDGVA